MGRPGSRGASGSWWNNDYRSQNVHYKGGAHAEAKGYGSGTWRQLGGDTDWYYQGGGKGKPAYPRARRGASANRYEHAPPSGDWDNYNPASGKGEPKGAKASPYGGDTSGEPYFPLGGFNHGKGRGQTWREVAQQEPLEQPQPQTRPWVVCWVFVRTVQVHLAVLCLQRPRATDGPPPKAEQARQLAASPRPI